ncbi:MAG: hypothetical protein ACREXU_20720, partial [Gammaproteobacteria bacterium]
IYQELIRDSAGRITTAFMRRVTPVKDNRLRPKGFDPEMFLRDPSPFIQILGEIDGAERNDPHYSDPKLTGADEITYAFTLAPAEAGRIARIKARVLSQSIPPLFAAAFCRRHRRAGGAGPDPAALLPHEPPERGCQDAHRGMEGGDRSCRSFHQLSGNARHLNWPRP